MCVGNDTHSVLHVMITQLVLLVKINIRYPILKAFAPMHHALMVHLDLPEIAKHVTLPVSFVQTSLYVSSVLIMLS